MVEVDEDLDNDKQSHKGGNKELLESWHHVKAGKRVSFRPVTACVSFSEVGCIPFSSSSPFAGVDSDPDSILWIMITDESWCPGRAVALYSHFDLEVTRCVMADGGHVFTGLILSHWLFQISRIGYPKILFFIIMSSFVQYIKGSFLGHPYIQEKNICVFKGFSLAHFTPSHEAWLIAKQIPKKNNQNHEQVLHCFYNCSIFKYWCIMVYIYPYILYNIVRIIHLSSFVRPYYAYLV